MTPGTSSLHRADRFAGMFAPAVVDLFAGCGGWSIGAEQAFIEGGYRDRYIDLAINHWDTAVGVHHVNHPLTDHRRASVFEVDPNSVLPGRHIAYLHASPDCTDFSKAKGSRPRRKEIRALADVVLVWAGKRRPDVITLENVEEFQQWGPLLDNGQPDPDRRGQEFQRWVRELRDLGYAVDWRELRACDYGAPTTRKRLFVVARCDGKDIVWPEKTHVPKVDDRAEAERNGVCSTHGDGSPDARCEEGRSTELEKGQPSITNRSSLRRGQRTARIIPVGRRRGNLQHGLGSCGRSEHGNDGFRCVERSTVRPYATAAECIDWSIPMLSIFATPAEAAAFGKLHKVGTPRRPLKENTLKRIARGVMKYVIQAKRPFIVHVAHSETGTNGSKRWGDPAHSVDKPFGTVTGSPSYAAVDVKVAPFTVPNLGERDGQAPRCGSVEAPLPTVTAKGNGARLVAATLQTLNHGGDEHRAQSPADPLHTVTGANDARALVAAMLSKHYTGVDGKAIDEPADTITAVDHHAVTCAFLSHMYGTNKGGRGDLTDPAATVTGSSNHAAIVVAFLSTYYGNGGETRPDEPAPTVTGRDRIGLVTVVIDGQTYVITDIAMRMLTPRELARAQGFPDSYLIERTIDGKPVSKADQVKLIGNSVAPPVARAIVKANVVDQGVLEDAREAVSA